MCFLSSLRQAAFLNLASNFVALQTSPKKRAQRQRKAAGVCAESGLKKQPEEASPERQAGCVTGGGRIAGFAPFSSANFIHMKPHSVLGPHQIHGMNIARL